MVSTTKSRWADDDADSAPSEIAAQRKREKEEKKRLKEEKLRKQQQRQQQQQAGTEPPSKRRKTSNTDNDDDDDTSTQLPTVIQQEAEKEGKETEKEGAHILPFPNTTFHPSHSITTYELLNNIEEGSYGFVSRARHKPSGDIVALKRLKLDNTTTTSTDGFPVTGLREIQTLRACDHEHIVKLREVVVDYNSSSSSSTRSGLQDVYLVLDFIEHDLKTLLDDNPEPFLPSEIKTLMYQISSAVAYLHSHYILHRDLKTSNLLLNNRGEIKLADFGMARYLPFDVYSYSPSTTTTTATAAGGATSAAAAGNLTQLVVTLWYRSPELLLGTQTYSFEIDTWSLGCIFAELLTNVPLFQGKNEVDQLSKIFTLLGTPTRESWPAFRNLPNAKALKPLLSNSNTSNRGNDVLLAQQRRLITSRKFPYLTNQGHLLLSSLLSLNPDHRPTAQEVLRDKYFTQDPRPKPKEMFPTFPSRAGQERRRRRQETPNAPVGGGREKGKDAPVMRAEDFEGLSFDVQDGEGM